MYLYLLLDHSKSKKKIALDTTGLSLISFRNGRINYSEKKLGLERHPSVIAAVFQFHQLIAQMKKRPGELPLSTIPTEYRSLIAMLVQERDVAVSSLAKSIETQLCPVVFGEESSKNSDILVHGVVESEIEAVALFSNYGIALPSLQKSFGEELHDVPPNLSIQRWEVRDLTLLPEDVREVVRRRREQRQAAHVECTQWFQSLNADTQSQMLAGTLKRLKVTKLSQPTLKKDSSIAISSGEDIAEMDNGKSAPSLLRGQKSLQSFFSTERSLERKYSTISQNYADTGKSYYESAFLGFHLRQNTGMYRYQLPKSFDPSQLDKVLWNSECSNDAALPQALLLKQFTAAVPLTHESVGKLEQMTNPAVCEGVELDEAELHMRKLRRMPMKLIQFHGTQRPAYWGTWSKQLRNVKGRRPFATDKEMLDYGVDSDIEWEAIDDEDGEELKSDDDEDEEDDDDDEFDEDYGFVVGDGNSDRAKQQGDDSSDDSSEFDSENEEMEDIDPSEEVCCSIGDMGIGTAVEVPEKDVPPAKLEPKNPVKHRKPHRHHRGSQPRRRKVVVPLVPVVIGLAWDETANSVDHDHEQNIRTLAGLTILPIEDSSFPLRVSVDAKDIQPSKQVEGREDKEADNSDTPQRKSREKELGQQDLVKFAGVVHGSSLGVQRLIEEIKPHVTPDTSKAQIERFLYRYAVKEKRPPSKRPMWYMKDEILQDKEVAEACRNDDVYVVIENDAKRQKTTDDPPPAVTTVGTA